VKSKHKSVVSHISGHRRKVEAGDLNISVNSHSLNSQIPKEHRDREHSSFRYDPMNKEFVEGKRGVLAAAKDSQMKLKHHAVTSAHECDED
jgi:hypothetical protein